FNLDDFTDEDVITNFRFTRDDIYKLCRLLQFPDNVTSTSRVTSTGLECLCIMLRRLAYPNRLKDLENMFGGRHQSEISVLCTYAVQHVYNTHRHLLLNINQTWIIDNIPLFAEAITNAGSPLTNCWGFVDGTVRPICRPTNNQREVFNGHKRVHALKFQSVMAPNGLIADLAGPFEGRRHDASLLRESQLLERIEAVPGLQYYCLYGDPAYPLRTTLINPFSGPHLTPDQENFNKAM
ncbi:hypothetical protein LSAT2_022053, partial [Lamellibrachia satsuma]